MQAENLPEAMIITVGKFTARLCGSPTEHDLETVKRSLEMVQLPPPGYRIDEATCGDKLIVMRERYDGAWACLRNEERKPMHFDTHEQACEFARWHADQDVSK